MRSVDAGLPTERRSADRVGSATVLVVDDSTAIRRILRRTLEDAGYRVEEATDGIEAIAACRATGPDVVLLDVDMPVMDGLSALAAMKADDVLSSIPVLFLTARSGGMDVARGLDLGAQDYLRKPCEPVELLARVAAALRSTERQDALASAAREAHAASLMDPLTGLGNRRLLETRAAELVEEAGVDVSAGLLIVDVDHFKLVNDEEGHPVGDIVLRILSRRLSAAAGSDVTVVRWGGEEFLTLVPGISSTGLKALGERLRASVGSTPFAIGTGRLLDVTVSVGGALGSLYRLKDLVKSADDALYDAKRSGRNRVALTPE